MSRATLDNLIALCKRRGFVYQTADLYGGLNGVYDFGHLGTLMRNNIITSWQQSCNAIDRGDILSFNGAILGPPAVWHASGHVEGFNDPMVDCLVCKHRYRTDDIDLKKPCPHCGNTQWSESRMFNMMFQTHVGAASDSTATAYLRPETAQSIFINFKNIITTNRVKLPFGVAQIGKAFRNEITPKQFLFRMREFEQMELEWFCTKETVTADFDFWTEHQHTYLQQIGITPKNLRLYEQKPDERAHYAQRTIDIEYNYPFGWKELAGIANRGTYDLKQHSQHAGKELGIFDEATQTTIIPHVVECSLGIDRLFLTLLFDAYQEDTIDNEQRVVLKLHPRIAPIKAALLPLSKKLREPMLKLYTTLKKQGISVQFDESGSIGKRYRRQDEIGTPICITYDFDSENDHHVTVRDRDTTAQKRIPIDSIPAYLHDLIAW